MNVLSLFDGMSCGRIALERAGIPVTNYFASEIDPYAIKVSYANHSDIKQLGDVKNISFVQSFDKRIFVINYQIDLLIGGSPCQGFSLAGKQLNFEDERSKLFFEFVRLKNECNPKYFLLENVGMKKEWQDVISSYLGVEPIMINSQLVSAQGRKRLYWTNIPNVGQPIDLNITMSDIMINNDIPANFQNQGKILKDVNIKKSLCLLARDYKGFGNQKMTGAIRPDGTNRKLTPIEYERLQNVPDNYTSSVSNSQRYKMLGNGWNVNTITHIFKNIPQ